MHVAKLRTVALVEYQHHVVLQHFQFLFFLQHDGQLLYRGYYYPCCFVVQLSFQYCTVGIAVGAVLLEVVILLHGLIVQVLPVHHKQHFLHFLHSCRQLCCLERCESLSASCGVPDVASSLCCSLPSVLYRSVYSQQYPFRCRYLVWAHRHQILVNCEHAIFRQHVQQSLFSQEGLCEVFKVGNYVVLRIAPI